MDINLTKVREYAKSAHEKAACTYDGQEYIFHCDMVEEHVRNFGSVFTNPKDLDIVRAGAFLHDTIEDARLTYNNIYNRFGKDIADIVLAVTDVPAENRLLRHLLTMPKTVLNYKAVILKLCDICANGSYSLSINSTMYKKYRNEYRYRRPIFYDVIECWYYDELDGTEVEELFKYLDNLFEFKN